MASAVAPVVDAAGADQRKDAFDPHIGLGQYPGRQGKQRPPRQTAGFGRFRGLAQARRPRQRGVADDHAVDPARTGDADDIVERGERKIRRDLEQHRRRTGCLRHPLAGVDHAGQQVIEHGGLLQVAQSRRVWRGNVDDDVARDRGEALDQPHIVGDAVRRVLVRPDIDADDPAAPGAAAAGGGKRRKRGGLGARREPLEHRVGALRIEAEPVDHPAIGLEPEHPRARITRLRQRRDGADLDKAETEPQQRVRHFGVLVETRGNADGIGEIEAERAHREPPVVAGCARQRRELQRRDREGMGILRIERIEQRPRQAREEADHGSSSGTT